MEKNVNFDSRNESFQNGEVHSGFAVNAPSGGIHVNDYRPFMHNGRPYVNRVTRDINGKLIEKAVPINVHAALRREEYLELDEAVLMISRERLGGIEDLRSRGLTRSINNAMGRTVLEYEDMDDPGEAIMTMDGVTRGPHDKPNYSANYIPLPIIHGDFEINERVLQTSRNKGDSMDTTMVESVTRRVLEKLEDLLFTNTSYTWGGGTIYSYLNQPSINTVTLSENWDASGKTAAEIFEDVRQMKQALINAKHFGPYQLYVPTDYETVLDEDYDTTTATGRTIRERLLQIEGISGIKVIDRLTADNVLMVQMTSDVVRLIDGFSPRVVQWSTQGGMVHNFKVMAIQVPQVRADQAGNSGICLLSA